MKAVHYFDYKSPYAYLAQEAAFALRDELGVAIEWLPYELDIPAYLGAAELDAQGRDVIGTRNDHQWRRVRYSYLDCRREAARRGLVIRGPRRIFDASLAHLGMLWAHAGGDFRPYHERVYERFWRRELDLEDPAAIEAVLAESGSELAGFRSWREGEGRARLTAIQREAQERGVFGVPSWWVDGELFWGAERLERVREKLGS
jgi:2-hydroxychromene-2-carboxylate isomerase